MEFEFDKEMDALLRQAARGESVSANSESEIQNPKSPHLDADEITLFAENALPEKAKTRFIEHFAGCDRCRKILSNVISLDAETIKKTIQASETAKISSVVPWYRRLFAAPNPAYALGAFLLVFGGIIAYTVLQSSNDSKNNEISQVESTEKMRGPNAGDQSPIIESNAAAMSNGGAAMSNSLTSMMSNSSMSNVGSAMSGLPAANSTAITPVKGDSMSNGASISNSAAASNKQGDERSAAARNEAQNAADFKAAKNDKVEADANGARFAEQKKQPTTEEKTRTADDGEAIQSDTPAPKSAPPAKTRSAPAELRAAGRTASSLNSVSARKSKSDAAETRSVGGKTFKRENGVWYDASYGGQATTNVSRGTNEYQKLDSGLRSIAGSLSGAIVVVYKGEAYRIQ